VARTLDRLGVEPLVADGGMGSPLSAAVLRARCPEEANLLAPELVLRMHLEFIRAGADIIQTNSYGANPVKLGQHTLDDRFEQINQSAVKIAREAREVSGRDVLIAGSIGPLGIAAEHLGDTRAGLYADQARLLEGRGVDLLVLETFTSLEELRAAVDAVCAATGLPLIAQVTVQDDAQTITGSRAADVAAAFAAGQLLAVGVNCSLGPYSVLAALEEMRPATRLPLTAQANAGLPQGVEGRFHYPNATPEYFGEFASHALALGAVVIGGCCGTTPVHVAAIRAAVSERRSPAVSIGLVEPELPTVRGSQVEETVLQGKLRRGEHVLSVELDPPKGANVERMIASAKALAASGRVDLFDINDNPLARARMNAIIASALIEQQTGLETIPHLTPRDQTIRGLESVLLGAHAVGIRNVLAVTGDPPPPGDRGGSDGVYQVDAIGLTEVIAALNRGVDYSGKSIDAPTAFHIGVAVNPAADDLEGEIGRFYAKIEAGAQFAMTQVLFDVATFERFLAEIGGSSPLPLLVGVWPVRSYALALRLHNEVPGIRIPEPVLARLERAGAAADREGLAIARELLDAFADLAAGAYLVPPFKEPEAVLELLG
jgi:methionine synthase I (cobalamin-dependent)/5,10-methylenetetrahydrofolate reductase